MDSNEINEFYYGKTYGFDPLLYKRTQNRIKWICEQVAGQNILDIGCGKGIVSILLAREGLNCKGLEIIHSNVEHALNSLKNEESDVKKRIHFDILDGYRLPFKDNSFDTVILNELLQNVFHPEPFYKESRRVLRENGKILLTVPFGLFGNEDYRNIYYPLSLFDSISRYFDVEFIDVVDGYIYMIGKIGAAGDKTVLDTSGLYKIVEDQILLNDYKIKEKQSILDTITRDYNELRNSLGSVEKDYLKKLYVQKEEFLNNQLSREREYIDNEKKALTTVTKKYERKLNELEQKNTELDKKLSELNKDYTDIRDENDNKIIALEKEINSFKLREQTITRGYEEKVKILQSDLEKLKRINEEQKDKIRVAEQNSLRKEQYLNKLVSLENQKNKELYELELLHKRSLSWRIGKSFVSSFIYARNFIYNPVKYTLDSKYRNKDISGFIYEGPEVMKSTDRVVPKYTSTEVKSDQNHKIFEKESEEELEKRATTDKLSFGAIMDVFTTACFRPECELITFRPDSWKTELENKNLDGLFVESAWHGNDGSWQYRVASYQKNMGDELIDLVNWAKSKNLPSIFWNKEDPPNYNRFIEKAGIFDYIFTTDADCIPKYNKDTGNQKVFSLPFAAQPKIHNPILEKQRQKGVCFAGTYYGNKHEERRKDMEFLLRPSLDFELDIYDRQYGLVGKQAEIFRFPDIYQEAIRGRLNYEEMLAAYKEYKVFLNVNSVKYSPTMFSRRVFELLASGTPVISTYSKGIVDLLGDDIVFITESEQDTRKHLERLLNDELQWKKASVRGIRKVMSGHTYEDRLDYICEEVGLKKPVKADRSFTVLSKCIDETSLDQLITTLTRQSLKPKGVLIMAPSAKLSQFLEKLSNAFKSLKISGLVEDSKETFRHCKNMTDTKYVAILDMKDYYGPEYLNDLALALKYSNADCIGKHAYYTYNPANKQFELFNKGYDYKKVNSALNATLMFDKEKLQISDANEFFNRGMLKKPAMDIISIDSFNFLRFENETELKAELLSECERNVAF